MEISSTMHNAEKKAAREMSGWLCAVGNHILCEWGKWRATGVPGLSYCDHTIEADLIAFRGDLPERQYPMSYWPRYTLHSKEAACERWHRMQVWADQWLLWVQYVGKDGFGIERDDRYLLTGFSKSAYYRKLNELQQSLAQTME